MFFVAEHKCLFELVTTSQSLLKVCFLTRKLLGSFSVPEQKHLYCHVVHDQLMAPLTNSSQPVFLVSLWMSQRVSGASGLFDTTVLRAVTRFLDLPTANDGTAAPIFEKIDETLMSRGIKYENFLCFIVIPAIL